MKQLIRAVTSPIKAQVHIPGSKSMTNRALLLAALADGVSELFDILISDDTIAFMNALRELGIVIQLDEDACSCIVAGCHGQFSNLEATIWCDKAGTVARFLLAACAGTPGTYTFDATPQLRARPIEPLLDILTQQGVKIISENKDHMPFTIQGSDRLQGGNIEIASEESSQFVSALLMIAPFSQHSVILTAHETLRHSYVDMTCEMMGDFGVLVRHMHQARYSIPAPQRYHAIDYKVEPDLSTASYFFAAAAVTGGKITIQAIDREHSKQGDIALVSVLEQMGCVVTSKKTGFSIQGPEVLQGVDVDMENFSDMFMTLAAIAPFANSPTTITNIAHTRLQESNRISAMRKGLESLKVKVEEGEDWIRIHPSTPCAGEIDSHADHRIAMAFSVIGLRVPGVIINGAECVSKTCPDFFKLWSSM